MREGKLKHVVPTFCLRRNCRVTAGGLELREIDELEEACFMELESEVWNDCIGLWERELDEKM